MYRPKAVLTTALFLAIPLTLAGCGPSGPTAEQKAAAEKKAAEEKKKKEEEAKLKAEREAKKKEEEEKQKAHDKKMDDLAQLPEKLPKKLKKACEQMVKAYDGYMQKVLTGDDLTKWTTGGNVMQVALFRKECLKGNVEIAACQTNALSTAPPEMKPHLSDFMTKCRKKFGKEGEAKGAEPPPPRPK
jgi:predicted small lipoprotein YifL